MAETKVSITRADLYQTAAGCAAAGIAFLGMPANSEALPHQIAVSAFVGLVTVACVREPIVAAVGLGYLAYEFTSSAAASLGQWVGLIGGVVGGGLVGHLVNDHRSSDNFLAPAVGGVAGAVVGYYSGGIAAAGLAIAAGGYIGHKLPTSRGLVAAVIAGAIGYFAVTTAIKEAVAPTPPPLNSRAAMVAAPQPV